MLTACGKGSGYHPGLAGDRQTRGGAGQPGWVNSLLTLTDHGRVSSQWKPTGQLLPAARPPFQALCSVHRAAHLTIPYRSAGHHCPILQMRKGRHKEDSEEIGGVAPQRCGVKTGDTKHSLRVWSPRNPCALRGRWSPARSLWQTVSVFS